MSLTENLLLAAALAADAFAVAIVRGMTGQGRNGDRLATAFCFAAAQTAMPALGRGSACRKHPFSAGGKDAARRNVWGRGGCFSRA